MKDNIILIILIVIIILAVFLIYNKYSTGYFIPPSSKTSVNSEMSNFIEELIEDDPLDDIVHSLDDNVINPV